MILDPNSEATRRHVVDCLCQTYSYFCKEYVSQPQLHGMCLKPLLSSRAPAISAAAYQQRLAHTLDLPGAVCLTALIYLDRLTQAWPDFPLTQFTFHRALAGCSLLSLKFLEDKPVNMRQFALSAGVSIRELRVLEHTCARALGWKLHVSVEEFDCYKSRVMF